MACCPSARGLSNTMRPPEFDTTVACRPNGSWSIRMICLLVSVASVAADALRRSVPMISGAAIIAHMLKCVWYSVSVMPPLPTSSMSGSFQAQGRHRGTAARSGR